VGACPNTHKTHQDGLLIFILSIQSYQHKLYLEKGLEDKNIDFFEYSLHTNKQPSILYAHKQSQSGRLFILYFSSKFLFLFKFNSLYVVVEQSTYIYTFEKKYII